MLILDAIAIRLSIRQTITFHDLNHILQDYNFVSIVFE